MSNSEKIETVAMNFHQLAEACLAERKLDEAYNCLLYTSPSPRDPNRSRMPSSA